MKVHIKVWTSDMAEYETFVFPGIFRPSHFVENFVKELEDRFPGNTFRTVPMGKSRYNVIPEPIANA